MKTNKGNNMQDTTKITALELSKMLDKFKDANGNVDKFRLKEVSEELKKFGPFYKDILTILALR